MVTPTETKRTLMHMTLSACVALACFGVVAPGASAETRLTIQVVELGMAKMEKVVQGAEKRIEQVADKALAMARTLGTHEQNQQRIFRVFQSRNFRLQIINFRTQQRLANIRQSMMDRMESIDEINPEATEMLEAEFSRFQGRVQAAFSTGQSRLQTIFTVAAGEQQNDPNGLRPLLDEDPDSGDDQ